MPQKQPKRGRLWLNDGSCVRLRPEYPGQRTKSAYIFGAICPDQGKGAGLILPFCNTETMSLHLAEITLTVAPGAHAVLLMDQAGWHMTDKLDVPDNISIIPIPSRSSELNPVENIWQFMRDNWLSNRIFTSEKISSTIVVKPGTGSSISHGASCPSACATGQRSSD